MQSGALYDTKIPINEIIKIAEKIKIKDISNFPFLSFLIYFLKIYFSSSIENFFNKYILNKTFNDLHILFTHITIDIKTGEKLY